MRSPVSFRPPVLAVPAQEGLRAVPVARRAPAALAQPIPRSTPSPRVGGKRLRQRRARPATRVRRGDAVAARRKGMPRAQHGGHCFSPGVSRAARGGPGVLEAAVFAGNVIAADAEPRRVATELRGHPSWASGWHQASTWAHPSSSPDALLPQHGLPGGCPTQLVACTDDAIRRLVATRPPSPSGAALAVRVASAAGIEGRTRKRPRGLRRGLGQLAIPEASFSPCLLDRAGPAFTDRSPGRLRLVQAPGAGRASRPLQTQRRCARIETDRWMPRAIRAQRIHLGSHHGVRRFVRAPSTFGAVHRIQHAVRITAANGSFGWLSGVAGSRQLFRCHRRAGAGKAARDHR
jgi:hypothetical protein